MRSKLLAVGCLALGMAIGSAPLAAEEARLSAVNFVPSHTAFGKPFADWAEKINGEAKGLVHVDIRASGAMSPFTMGSAVQSGVVDMGYVPFTFYQNLLPIGDAMKLSTKMPEELRTNGTWEFLNELHNRHVNAQYLGAVGMNVPFHVYLRANRKIDKPDLSGLRIRITPIYRAFFRALGADVVQMAPGEVYTALERGVIDGFGWPIWDLKGFGWDRHTKYRVDPGFYVTGQAILVNLDRWRGMTEQQRDFLTRSAYQFELDMWEKAKELNEHYRKEQDAGGIEVIEFAGEHRDYYQRTAIEAGWKEAHELDPVNAPKLRALITND